MNKRRTIRAVAALCVASIGTLATYGQREGNYDSEAGLRSRYNTGDQSTDLDRNQSSWDSPWRSSSSWDDDRDTRNWRRNQSSADYGTSRYGTSRDYRGGDQQSSWSDADRYRGSQDWQNSDTWRSGQSTGSYGSSQYGTSQSPTYRSRQNQYGTQEQSRYQWQTDSDDASDSDYDQSWRSRQNTGRFGSSQYGSDQDRSFRSGSQYGTQGQYRSQSQMNRYGRGDDGAYVQAWQDRETTGRYGQPGMGQGQSYRSGQDQYSTQGQYRSRGESTPYESDDSDRYRQTLRNRQMSDRYGSGQYGTRQDQTYRSGQQSGTQGQYRSQSRSSTYGADDVDRFGERRQGQRDDRYDSRQYTTGQDQTYRSGGQGGTPGQTYRSQQDDTRDQYRYQDYTDRDTDARESYTPQGRYGTTEYDTDRSPSYSGQERYGTSQYDTDRSPNYSSQGRYGTSEYDTDRNQSWNESDLNRSDSMTRYSSGSLQSFRGRIQSIDQDSDRIIVRGPQGQRTFRVDDTASLVRDGRSAELDDFEEGDQVAIQFRGSGVDQRATSLWRERASSGEEWQD